MRNVSTWSDRSKKLPSTSCLLGIRKSNKHCSKVVSVCWRKNTRKTRVTDTRVHDDMVPWALRALGTKMGDGPTRQGLVTISLCLPKVNVRLADSLKHVFHLFKVRWLSHSSRMHCLLCTQIYVNSSPPTFQLWSHIAKNAWNEDLTRSSMTKVRIFFMCQGRHWWCLFLGCSF